MKHTRETYTLTSTTTKRCVHMRDSYHRDETRQALFTHSTEKNWQRLKIHNSTETTIYRHIYTGSVRLCWCVCVCG